MEKIVVIWSFYHRLIVSEMVTDPPAEDVIILFYNRRRMQAHTISNVLSDVIKSNFQLISAIRGNRHIRNVPSYGTSKSQRSLAFR